MSAPAITTRGPVEEASAEAPEGDLEGFLSKVVKRFNKAESAESVNRQKALEDLRFKAGDQWPEQIRAQRTLDLRPCLTINKMKTFVHQIVNDQRQNRPSIGVSPIGDRADPETAKMLKGLIKQIERTSNADVAYDTGFDSAVSIGWGYWRIVTDYEDEDSFDQIIKILRIRNPFRVYLDPDSEEPDGSDAKWGFISDLIPRSEFKETWPDSPIMPWEEGGIGDEYKLWATQSHVRIAEYFCYETDTRELVALRSGHIGYRDELADEIKRQIEADPDLVVNSREVPCKKVKWYKLTAYSILEENDWAGKHIPIIKIIGDEVDIEGKLTLAGIIRDAKDSQRNYNFWRTCETEMIALAPKAPWLLEEGQIEGHENEWQQANTKSYPFLTYKGSSVAGKPSPPPQRQQFAGPPAGVIQAAINAAQDMQATTGIRFDATLQERNYDESGKALKELKRVGEIGNFHYIDNLSRSLRYTGSQLIDLFRKVYDTKRILTILREDGSEERVTIDPTLGKPHDQKQGQDGRVERLFNPKLGDYEVAVTIGPSFATKRAEAADSMLQFLRFVPNAAPVVADLIAKNMDWPGAEEIYTRLASMLPPQLQQKNMQNLPPEAKGLVNSLMTQLQQMKQEHDKAVALLGNQDKDRAIDKEALANERMKITADLEAKLKKIDEDFQKALLQVQHKADGKDASHQVALDYLHKMEELTAKVEADRQKALIDIQKHREKLEADLMVKHAELQMKHAEMQMNHQAKAEDRKEEGKAMRRTTDFKDLEGVLKKLTDRMDKYDNSEIQFIRDKKTNRLTGAKRVNH